MTERIAQRLPDRFNAAAYFLGGKDPGRIALYAGDERWTYGELSEAARRAAGLFAALGARPEERVALLLADCPAFVVAFWGAIWAGMVPVPVNTACGLDDIRHILADCRSTLMVTTRAWVEKLSPLLAPRLAEVLLVDGEEPFLARVAAAPEQPEPAPTHRDEPAFWLYTSGSTGRPKGVIHAHASPVVAARLYGTGVLDLRPDDITYSIARLPFAYGLGNSLYLPMAVGGATVLSDAANAFDVVADIRRHRPTVLFGIPSLYAAILAAHEIAEPDFTSLRLCVSAAEQLPRPLWWKWFETYGLEICEGIGTTELTHIFLSNRPEQCRPGSSGKPVPGYDVRIVDEAGNTLPPGEMGLLQVGGESLMLGYWNRLDATRAALHGSEMVTGDRYRVDDEGWFYFMGRHDDFFKVNGLWVSPFEIEEALLAHPGVLDAAVVPQPDGGGVNSLVAFVSLKDGFAPTTDILGAIRREARAHLPAFKVPRTIHVLGSLPRTPTGKVHRRALLAMAAT